MKVQAVNPQRPLKPAANSWRKLILLGFAIATVVSVLFTGPRLYEWYFITQLRSPDLTKRRTAAVKLGELRSQRAVPLLIEELEWSGEFGHPAGRRYEFQVGRFYADMWSSFAVEPLVRIGRPAVPALRCLAADETAAETARVNAVLAIGDIGANATEAIPDLVEILHRESGDLRRAAAFAMTRIGPQCIPRLVQLLEEPETGVFAAYTIAHFRTACFEYLKALDFRDEPRTINVIRCLREICRKERNDEGLRLLASFREDEREAVRMAAEEAVAECGL